MGQYTEPLFTKDFIEWSAQKFDDTFFKKGWPDVVDKLAFKGVLSIVNGQLSDEIPDVIKPDLHEAQALVVAGDYDDGGAEAVAALIELVKASAIKEKAKQVIVTALGFVESILEGLD